MVCGTVYSIESEGILGNGPGKVSQEQIFDVFEVTYLST